MADKLSLPRIGDRIELVAMPDDPDPIFVGEQGTVDDVQDLSDFSKEKECYQISVKWDSGRTLSLMAPPDQFRILTQEVTP